MNLIKDNIQTTLQILNEFSKPDILSFWTYLFDGPHPNDKVNKGNFETLYKSVIPIDSTQAKLMTAAFKKLSTS